MYSLKNSLNICSSSIFRSVCHNALLTHNVKKVYTRIPDEMVFNKETDCSLHGLIEGILNNACKNLKNVEYGNIRYMYCWKRTVYVSQVFLCALHQCSHILGIKVNLEQKIHLSSYKLCVSSRKVDYFLEKKSDNQKKISYFSHTVKAEDKLRLTCSMLWGLF